MIENLTGLLTSFKKVAPVPLLAISFAASLIILCPNPIAEALGVDVFRITYRPWIGTALIVSVSYLMAHIFWWLRGLFLERHTRKQTDNVRHKHLRDLTPDEKAYLVPYVRNQITSQKFLVEDGIAGGLMAKGIIYRSSNVGSANPWSVVNTNKRQASLNSFIPPTGSPRGFQEEVFMIVLQHKRVQPRPVLSPRYSQAILNATRNPCRPPT